MDVVLLIPLIPRGLVIGMLLTAALAVVLLLFAGGYWYLIKRSHQADEPVSRAEQDAQDGSPRRR
jgi:hypothetical protein